MIHPDIHSPSNINLSSRVLGWGVRAPGRLDIGGFEYGGVIRGSRVYEYTSIRRVRRVRVVEVSHELLHRYLLGM